jgi:polar amino acid transport system substrate-binding protein
VARYALKIAERLGLDLETTRKIYWAGYLHDIGKIFVPQDILNKPTKLTKEEYELVKIHPVKSEELVLEIEGLEEIAKIIRHHHERWDGKGYPDGLSDDDIPLGSRILGIADAFEAMTSERPYKKALTLEEAIEELKGCSGTQFDPKLVEIMVSIIEEELKGG